MRPGHSTTRARPAPAIVGSLCPQAGSTRCGPGFCAACSRLASEPARGFRAYRPGAMRVRAPIWASWLRARLTPVSVVPACSASCRCVAWMVPVSGAAQARAAHQTCSVTLGRGPWLILSRISFLAARSAAVRRRSCRLDQPQRWGLGLRLDLGRRQRGGCRASGARSSGRRGLPGGGRRHRCLQLAHDLGDGALADPDRSASSSAAGWTSLLSGGSAVNSWAHSCTAFSCRRLCRSR